MPETRLILMCGMPATGKTTLAKRLAAERHALRLEKDAWLWALGTTPWDAEMGERVEGQLRDVTSEALRLGLSVVFDAGLWTRTRRDELRALARDLGVGVELHYLDAPVEELWRRFERRISEPPWNRHSIERRDLDRWAAHFEPPDAAELALFDPPPLPSA